ncbi:uncharacterized protein LOC133817775 [Humulus lupulus]|uniref:uncharacterized protein LOC133817775 n=1 Tax=Humulus lupulus TaxID=3486 RepID=UPI002B415E19|nr:uncharacterized protein LOC133817775 [Humulus lupulus]XP_062106359.1 uncharacterized protein LOC133817775 [Humulus lupulus]XP_062106360.1 uncharacterized protein LOC133817775 [Humulus lupulus]
MAQSHEGDGGCDPPCKRSHLEADCERAPPRKRGRNKGLSTKQLREKLGHPIPLEWDVQGGTYKEIGDYYHHLSREIGILVRRYTDPNYLQWAHVPEADRLRILPQLEDDLFDIGRERYEKEHLPGILAGINQSCASRYSEWKNDLKTHLDKYGPNTPHDGCTLDQWKKAVEYFARPEVKKRSEINSANRKKMKQPSIQGSISTPALRHKKRDLESGRPAAIPETWQSTHFKITKGWTSQEAKDNWDKLLTVRDTQQSQSFGPSLSAPSAMPEDDFSLVESVFGRRRGFQPGYGRVLSLRAQQAAVAVPPPPLPPSIAETVQDLVERVRALEEYIRKLGGGSGSGSQQTPPAPDDLDPTGSSH